MKKTASVKSVGPEGFPYGVNSWQKCSWQFNSIIVICTPCQLPFAN
ncbi:MAG: hypothetical protein ACOCVX_00250 [Bacteroidales bacterium]